MANWAPKLLGPVLPLRITAAVASLKSTPRTQPRPMLSRASATTSITWRTRVLPVASFRLRWSQSMPESSTAMPTPLPSTAAPPTAAGTAELPEASCSRLPVRAVIRLGVMAITSLRAARLSRAEAGTRPARPRIDR